MHNFCWARIMTNESVDSFVYMMHERKREGHIQLQIQLNTRKEQERQRWKKLNFFVISRSSLGSTKLLLDSCLSSPFFSSVVSLLFSPPQKHFCLCSFMSLSPVAPTFITLALTVLLVLLLVLNLLLFNLFSFHLFFVLLFSSRLF